MYYCGQESLRRNGLALRVSRRVQNAVLGAISKQNDLGSFPRQTIQHHSTPNLCPNHWYRRSWSLTVLWRPTSPSRLTPREDVVFILKDWNSKVGSQGIPRRTGKLGLRVQNEAGQRLTEFSQENTLAIANTLSKQPKRQLCTWISPNGQYQNQTDYVLCSQRRKNSTESVKTRPGADCGSDHELLFVKFRLKLKKVGKTTRPFRYELNQIPYDYTVEVTNRFKGLDLVDRVPEELWMEIDNTVQETVTKTIPKKKKCKKAK